MQTQNDNPRQRSRIVAVRGSKTTPQGDYPHKLVSSGGDFRRWGDDNMFPELLALMSRRSTTHRRIINDKADYISGNDFAFDPDGRSGAVLGGLTKKANEKGESLRQVFNKIAFDKVLFGNAFLEIVTDDSHSFLSLHHQDASRCRVARDEGHIILHHDWAKYRSDEAKRLPLFPRFEGNGDGLCRSVIHYKDYEPMFTHYGVPSYIAGMNVSSIAWKTDNWNIARLDNSFQLSGVMMLDGGGVDNPVQAEDIMRTAEKKFAGRPGQVMFMLREGGSGDSSQFIPITSGNEGDWRALHDQATGDIVVAHSWFRSLSGLDYGGFSPERIVHEYELALNTVILPEQAELLEPVRRVIEHVLSVDASSLDIVNKPPKGGKSLYMKVWEARRADGLDYDPDDPDQKLLLAQITKYNLRSID